MTSRPVKEVNYVLVVNTISPKAIVKVDFIEAGLSLAKTADSRQDKGDGTGLPGLLPRDTTAGHHRPAGRHCRTWHAHKECVMRKNVDCGYGAYRVDVLQIMAAYWYRRSRLLRDCNRLTEAVTAQEEALSCAEDVLGLRFGNMEHVRAWYNRSGWLCDMR